MFKMSAVCGDTSTEALTPLLHCRMGHQLTARERRYLRHAGFHTSVALAAQQSGSKSYGLYCMGCAPGTSLQGEDPRWQKKRYAVAYFTPLDGITAARKVTKYRAFVCLFVWLLSNSRKNHWSDLHENFTKDMRLRTGRMPLNLESHLYSDPELGIFKGYFNIALRRHYILIQQRAPLNTVRQQKRL